MSTPNPDEIWRLLNEARFEEASEAKVAALERAVEAADAVGDPELVNYSLSGLVDAYEFSRDSTRILVPFARLLRNFDTRPEHFDAYLTRSLYWTFKWIVDKMIEQPDVPLASIEHWLSEMRRRYAEAGHSMHAPASYEMQLAFHIGDYDRVATAIEAVGEAEEDEMSDCAACQFTSLATIVFYAEEDSADACMEMLDPVLSGEYSCAHEPHYALALSLIPLVELGRLDQARANHLRGYTMCKGKEDMITMITLHAEFCALTGNEARAVEILSDHARFYDLDLGARDRQGLMEVTVLTCRRLDALGLGQTPMRGPDGREWSAADLGAWAETERVAIVARFDARNGNDHHSEWSRCMTVSTPYPEPVHLGLKEVKPEPEPFAVVVPDEPVEGADLDKAIDAAYAEFDACSQSTWQAWLHVAAVADRLGIELIAEHRAEIAHARASEADEPEQVLAHLTEAADLFEHAEQPGRALVAESFALIHSADNDPEHAHDGIVEVTRTAEGLRAEQRIDERSYHTSLVLALRAELIACGVERSGPDAAPPDMAERLHALDDELSRLPEHRYAVVRRCDVLDMRAEVATDAEAKRELLLTALEIAVANGLDWAAARSHADLADQFAVNGRFEEASASAEAGAAMVDARYNRGLAAKLHLQAAEFAMRRGDFPATYRYALDASVHCDAAGMHAPSAVARHLMGVALVEQDRRAEAVPILEAALAELPETEIWRLGNIRYNLAECYDLLDDTRQAAEHGLAALTFLERADDDHIARLYADMLFLTGNLLEKLGENEHALEVYTRAAVAADELGDLTAWTRVSRARIWLLHVVAGDAAFGEGLQTMAQIAARLQAARSDTEVSERFAHSCLFELGETYRQHAQLTFHFLESQAGEPGLRREEAEPVLDLQRRALAVFRDGGYVERAGMTAHQTMWLLSELDDAPGAIAVGQEALEWLSGPETEVVRQGFEQHLSDLRNPGQ